MIRIGCVAAASLLVASAAPTSVHRELPAKGAEIVWDTYGVPHIFGADDASMLRAFGWAQMRNHGDLLLTRIGIARGRAAEYWRDSTYLASDLYARNMRIDDAVAAATTETDPKFKALMAEFASGINQYARTHPEALTDSLEVVLPVTAEDVLANAIYVGFLFSAAEEQLQAFERGSNAWAIGPAKSASGRALLLGNPHLPWGGALTWFEAQLESPTTSGYGATLIGMPTLTLAFTDRLAWTHTVNTTRSEDFYELTPSGDGYLWQGSSRAFVMDTQRVRIKQKDGALKDSVLVRRQSVHGPVIGKRGDRMLAVHRLQARTALSQWWDMVHARDLKAFERAIERNQIVGQNIVYADADGNIMYFYGAAVPRRTGGSYALWTRRLPGDTAPDVLWTEVHAPSELPRVVNPPSGWVQNANDPPWFSTYPPALRPTDFPAYFAPVNLPLRPQRSIRLLEESGKLTFDDVVRLKHSTHVEMADRVLPELIAAARASGSEGRQKAADVLTEWDRTTDAASRGGTLFEAWAAELMRRSNRPPYRERWNIADPLNTPRGLADTANALAALDSAAAAVSRRFGALDVEWGRAHRFRRDSVDVPGNGGAGTLGVFRNIAFVQSRDGTAIGSGGDSFVMLVEFSNPVRAAAVLAYGNASQAGSLHRTDQLQFASAKQMRPVWRTRAEVERHASKRETL